MQRKRSSSAPSDGELACLAGPLRVLTLEQLSAARLAEQAIRTRVAQGRLQRLWRGIYLVGPTAPDPLSLARAADLTYPGRGFVSANWSAYVHGFGPVPRLPVDVLLTRGSHKRGNELRIHRSRIVQARDLGDCQGIAVTSAARAILDAGDTATVAQLEALIADARVINAVTPEELDDVLSRAGRRAAARRLCAAMADSPGITRSEAERLLLRLLHQAGIEQPITDYPIGPYRADFAWLRQMLLGEFDSYRHHSGKPAFHHDRERAAWLTAQGWSILPVTYEHVAAEPLKTAARIAAALAIRG
jgi:very-short-patch-repair endonuclease